MTQPFKPQFVRSTPEQGAAPSVGTPIADPTGGFGYSPMAEMSPEEVELTPEPGQNLHLLSFIRDAAPRTKAPAQPVKPRKPPTPEQVRAQQFLADNPRSADNIVAHYDQSTPEHVKQGMSWYKDAHHAAKVIARDHGISVNQAAGLIANYSPQQHWAQNLRMASLAAGGQVIGGPKQPGQEGFMASAGQARAAQRILAGEDFRNVFAGKKIKAFGHLIEHGQDTDPNDPQVVVDRHALGVAHNNYADEHVYNASKVSASPRINGSSPVYDEVAQMYKDAADHVSKRDGVQITPHQMQAVTWLTRQRLNADGGYTNNSNAPRVQKVAETYTNKWNEYASQRHPDLVGKVPGTGFSDAVGQGAPVKPQLAVASLIRTAGSSQKDFTYDAVSDQYKTSNLTAKFSCNCGKQFSPGEMHKCGCGQTWVSFDIIPGEKTAGTVTRIVRPVREHRDRVLAKVGSKTNKCDKCSDQATTKVLWAEGMAYVPACDKHKEAVKKERGSDFSGFKAYASPGDFEVGGHDSQETRGGEDYRWADSTEQQPDSTQSVDIPNEFTQGVEPGEGTEPYFVRKDPSADAAPTVVGEPDKRTAFRLLATGQMKLPAKPRY